MGRFSVCTWPPQVKQITNVIWANETSNISSRRIDQAQIAKQIALANNDVQQRLGDRYAYIYTSPIRPEKWSNRISGHIVTFFSYSQNETLEVHVADNSVITIEGFAASEKQPPLHEDEDKAAVAIARQYWLDQGITRVNQLRGYTIQTFRPDEGGGGLYDTRMAYVSFHIDEAAPPELLTWIDLTQETVFQGREGQRFQDEPNYSLWIPLTSTALKGNGSGPIVISYEPAAGNIDWEGWQFDYELGYELDGLAINNVTYQGTKIMSRGSFPAMPVYYEDNQCGPYLDIIGYSVTVDWAPTTDGIVSREFAINDEVWYELGVRQILGHYDIYQVWYFSPDGIIDAHLFSRGLECTYFHEHYPHWRFDFDLDGPENDQILRQTSAGFQAMTTEFNVTADTAVDHGWVVRDTQTDYQVSLTLDPGTWNVPGTVIPETMYTKNRIAGRRSRPDEFEWFPFDIPNDWDDGVNQIPFGNGENINSADLAIWYSGYLPHEASEGAFLWHSTGVRLTLNPVR